MDQYDQFLAEVLKDLSPEERQAIEGTLKNDKIAGRVRERVLARSDYSRSMDALKKEREQFESVVAEANRRISGWDEWYKNTSAETETLRKQVEHYRTQYGNLGDDGMTTTRPVGLTEEEFTKRLAAELENRDRAAIAVADMLTDMKIDHRDRFKEPLDTEKLITFAGERGLPLKSAYREFIAPRVEEQQKESFELKLKEAREEGRKAALSENRLPVVSDYGMPHVLDQTDGAGKTRSDRVRAAVADWNNSQHSGY